MARKKMIPSTKSKSRTHMNKRKSPGDPFLNFLQKLRRMPQKLTINDIVSNGTRVWKCLDTRKLQNLNMATKARRTWKRTETKPKSKKNNSRSRKRKEGK
ncbi:unnamed protein product [Acanthoscelides obtectus]|uniref:Uncharacterized protein n=1 Tax=Acanthoscelides obtectus TaxID=200917 RepID=A0A9P0JNY8_ACAOB|nr:unnamed protein product [Acanthoscelides obtectus]CAK1634839.1 hypothetical protein AOBTE_LOCUS8922 [Acanthoscelides obtectus]